MVSSPVRGALGKNHSLSDIPKSLAHLASICVHTCGVPGPVLDAKNTALNKVDRFSLLPKTFCPVGRYRGRGPESLVK